MSDSNASQPDNNADRDQQLEAVIADYIRSCETGTAPDRGEILKRDEFRGNTEAELAAWLREILKHKLADALRDQQRDKRDVRRECTIDEGIDASFSRTEGWLVSMQSSPSQKAVKQEDLLRLSQALTELPEAQREVIVLHHLQGQKLADVAAEINRSEAAVAGLLFRGLRTLHSLLGD